MRQIDELFTSWPFLGLRRLTALLRTEGHSVNRKRVQRLQIDPVLVDLWGTACLMHEQGHHAAVRRVDEIALRVLAQQRRLLSGR